MRAMVSKALADVKMAPFWPDRPDRPETLPPLTASRKTDPLVAGGGFTGLWAAIHARQAKPDCAMIKLSTDGEPRQRGAHLRHARRRPCATGFLRRDLRRPGRRKPPLTFSQGEGTIAASTG